MSNKILIIFLFFIINIQSEQNIHAGNSFGPWRTKLVNREKIHIEKPLHPISAGSWFLNIFIKFFYLVISPQDGPRCRYSPTCAKYGEICIQRYGPFLGTVMATDRFLRCNPFGAYGKDLPEDNYFGKNKEEPHKSK